MWHDFINNFNCILLDLYYVDEKTLLIPRCDNPKKLVQILLEFSQQIIEGYKFVLVKFCFQSTKICDLKGNFSSGIEALEGALASTLNRDFNWKQLSEMILCIFLLMFSKFIWVTLIQKQQKYK